MEGIEEELPNFCRWLRSGAPQSKDGYGYRLKQGTYLELSKRGGRELSEAIGRYGLKVRYIHGGRIEIKRRDAPPSPPVEYTPMRYEKLRKVRQRTGWMPGMKEKHMKKDK